VNTGAFTRYAELEFGNYEVAIVTDLTSLAPLAARASSQLGVALAIREARVIRLSPGDYILAHHDRLHTDYPVEIVLDLSPAPLPRAELHYRRRGNVFHVVPVQPGAFAAIERGPTVTSNHVYVSKLNPPDARVVRLIALATG